MNIRRLLLTILAGFAFVFATDYLIHVLWLAPDYKASAALWRPEDEMKKRFLILLFAQFLCALAFVYIWGRTGWRRRTILDGATFGFWMGLFQQVTSIVLYVVSYLPWQLALKWIGAGLLQSILLGALAAVVYRPRTLMSERRD